MSAIHRRLSAEILAMIAASHSLEARDPGEFGSKWRRSISR